MARGGDMQEVELLDGDEDVAVQPSPPARDRRRLWWVPVGAAAVALSLVGTQLVVDAREDAAAARLAAVPGVFPPLGDELEVLRTISQAEASTHLGGIGIGGARTAGLVVATDGSQSFAAVDQRTGETLWSTPLLGPDADRAASLENAYGGSCQGDGARGTPATVAVCLVTDGFVRYEDDGAEERLPATTTQVVVLDTGDGHVITQWEVEETSQLALVGELAVVGTRGAERGVVVVAHDVTTGDEQWRYDGARRRTAVPETPPTSTGGSSPPVTSSPMYDGRGLAFLSPTGTLIREDLRAASRDCGFGTDPVTGIFAITSYSGGSARITTLLAPDADPAGDVAIRGEPVQVTVDDGSLPGLVLTCLSHAYALDRQTGEQRWEADVQPSYSGLVIRGRVYLTTSTEVLSLDGLQRRGRLAHPAAAARHRSVATDGRDLLAAVRRRTTAPTTAGDRLRPRDRARRPGRSPYPEGVSDVQLLHGLLVRPRTAGSARPGSRR